MIKKSAIKKSVLFKIVLSGVLLVSGCSGLQKTQPIVAGEKVKVNFSCSIKDKGLVTTTQASVAENKAIKKSNVFAGKSSYLPVDITAGREQGREPEDLRFLMPEILFRIAEQAPGKQYGKTYDMELTSEVSPTIQDNNRYRWIKRVRYVPKIRTLDRKIYEQRNIPVPEAGNIEKNSDGVPRVRIVEVTDTEIKKELIVNKDMVLPYFCGELRVEPGKDKDTVKVVIDSQVGRLVRTGSIIGRVIEVNDKHIKIDYGHPFAGFPLECKVEFLEKETGGQK